MKNVPEEHLRREYRARFKRFIKGHRRPGLVFFYVFHMAMHYHTWKMAERMSSRSQQLVNSF